ncbi:CRISPR-associated helicase Cas3' [Scardovia wiggsiae]|uniref:CRISPR-associated helicase Cas3' n=1 Tax=Scardovia wiggsiae TaxID=230143 RepID=UPI003BA9BEC8
MYVEVDKDNLELSEQARSIWAKSNMTDDQFWLPLYVHMSDSAEMAKRLWESWLPNGIKSRISRDLSSNDLSFKLAVLVAGIHDIGKASPVFQDKKWGKFGSEFGFSWIPERAGLTVKPTIENIYHPIIGEMVFDEYLKEKFDCKRKDADHISCILGGHHGTFPTIDGIQIARRNIDSTGYKDESWKRVQFELIDFICRKTNIKAQDMKKLGDLSGQFSPESESLLTGLVIMADWLASNPDYFPLVPVNEYAAEFGRLTDKDLTELISIRSIKGLQSRAERAWERINLAPCWHPKCIDVGKNKLDAFENYFKQHFSLPEGAQLRPMQQEALDVAQRIENPGLMIIEAPMGEGKTETALTCAEIFAQKTGRGGVCVALPTMATTNAMFSRTRRWIDKLDEDERYGRRQKTIYLSHSKSSLNEEYTRIVKQSYYASTVNKHGQWQDSIGIDRDKKQEADKVLVSDWFWGRKRGALVNFLVCTVDQMLMAALKMKHVVLRQLGIANKVVIIDECHAYDAYMQKYLCRVLQWLGGFGTPVILLSATLSNELRNKLVNSYCEGADADGVTLPTKSDDYPLITYTDGSKICISAAEQSGRKSSVACRLIEDDDEAVVDLLKDKLSEGGCAGVICDTVGRAQELAKILRKEFGSGAVKLSHSRFLDRDRMENENELQRKLGAEASVANGQRPDRYIVVGTQVLEQSLDIDFDLLITDIAPIDLLLQRLGRMHRHYRGENQSDRPVKLRQAYLYIRGITEWADDGLPTFAKGLDKIYFAASLYETLIVLNCTESSDMCEICIPDDIALLVRTAYDKELIKEHIPLQWGEAYKNACEKRHELIMQQETKAKTYLLFDLVQLRKEGNPLLLDGNDSQTVDNSIKRLNEEERGKMAVRDTEETVEVLVVQADNQGISLLPWISDGEKNIPVDCEPEEEMSKLLLQCAVNLPASLSVPWKIDGLIDDLETQSEKYVKNWQNSPWLAGKLLLILDSDRQCNINGTTVMYSQDDGLEICP